MHPKTLKILIVVVAIAVCAFLVIGVTASMDDTKTDGPVDADLRFDLWAEEIETSYDVIGNPVYPEEGMKFVLMHFKFANDTVDEGIPLHPKYSEWKAVSNNIEYNQHWTTYTHPDITKASTLYKGGQIDDVRVFEIPAQDDVDSLYFNINVYGISVKITILQDVNLIP